MKVITYNTHLFGTSPGGVIGDLSSAIQDLLKRHEDMVVWRDEDRRKDIQSVLHRLSPDMIGLSEVWDRDFANGFCAGLRASHPHVARDGIAVGQGSGLLLLSRFPLSGTRFVRFHRSIGNDRFALKGFLITTANVDGAAVTLVLTHTQAGEGNESKSCRVDNFGQMIAELKADPDVGGRPALIMGDFNVIGEAADGAPTTEYASLCAKLGAEGLTDTFRALWPDTVSAPGFTYDATLPNSLIAKFSDADYRKQVRQRLDYVFARGFCVRRAEVPVGAFMQNTMAGPQPLSDHDPLSVELEWD